MSRTAAAFLQARLLPLRMVIFDCDGVLIDSETLCNRVVLDDLIPRGWTMDFAATQRAFLGLSFPDSQPAIERILGRSIGEDWVSRIVALVTEAMAEAAEPIPGACAALEAVNAMGLPWRVASNSSLEEMDAKFTRAGMKALTAGRLHSAYEIIKRGGHGKPAPDVFLDAAAAEGIDPAFCLVIEDSVPGATAARAAGMACLGFAPHGDGAELAGAGAVPFHAMADLPALLRGAPR